MGHKLEVSHTTPYKFISGYREVQLTELKTCRFDRAGRETNVKLRYEVTTINHNTGETRSDNFGFNRMGAMFNFAQRSQAICNNWDRHPMRRDKPANTTAKQGDKNYRKAG